MKAAVVDRLDGPEAVVVRDVEAPRAAAGQVLIRVHAAAVSFPELLQTRGQYQARFSPPFVPGSEVAGRVVSAPERCGVEAGARVVAVVPSGGLAEYVAADAAWTFPLADQMSYQTAAALPSNYLTAHFALIRRGALARGERVLVHGAAGGLGSACVQVAKAFGAGVVIAVTSNEAKAEAALGLGADEVVLADQFAARARGLAVDIVADPVGGESFIDSLRSLRELGRLLVLGFASGSIPAVKVNRLLLNNVSVVGVGYGAYAFPRPGFLAGGWGELQPFLASGQLSPLVGQAFALDDVVDAFLALESRHAVGKVVVTM